MAINPEASPIDQSDCGSIYARVNIRVKVVVVRFFQNDCILEVHYNMITLSGKKSVFTSLRRRNGYYLDKALCRWSRLESSTANSLVSYIVCVCVCVCV